jgi:D-alanyl-D-alanine carboxypeptidase (penicillin-binding protein 5/6)
VFAGLLLLAAVGYLLLALLRTVPEPALVPVPLPATVPGPPPALAWPAQGQSAAGVEGVGPIGTHGSHRPTPIASLAKVMTAYLVLRAHPLASGASGPPITVRPADAAAYRADLAAGQSVVAVRAGERLTERQALEALLLPSGNNIATLLAKWEAGSEAAFVATMNAQARALGLTHTHYADASGVRAATVSTAGDQLRLAMLALKDPVFAQIVAMPQVTLPVAGRQYNVDALLGRDGIVGVKTGSTSRAGGCFVFAAHERLGGRTVTVVGAVLHQLATRAQPSIIDAAFDASRTLLASVRRVVVSLPIVRRGATVAWVRAPWADRLRLRASRSASLLGWPGLPITTRIATVRQIAAPLSAGERIGTAMFAAGAQGVRVALITSRTLPRVSLAWRLTHP